MTTQPPRSYTKLAIALVVVTLIIGGAVYILFFAGTTTTIPKALTSAQDAPLGSTLGLHISANAGGPLSIFANVTNLLNRVNNVTTANDWPYPSPDSAACGDYDQFPIQYAVFQGYYDASNYTSAADLSLYNTAYLYQCPTESAPAPYLLFAPLSDNVSRFDSSPQDGSYLVSADYSVTGYWTGSQSTSAFHHFQPGVYTVLAEDEWGGAALLHFTVSSNV
jgi:hypothetical protein